MTEISNEYAAALFMLALEEGKAEEYGAALESISGILKSEPEYAELLSSPAIPVPERVKAAEMAFSSYPEYIVNFIGLLCEKGRMRVFDDIVSEYTRLLQEHLKTSTATVTSAIALTEEEKKALCARLERLTGHSVRIVNVTDRNVIGGLVIEIDGRIIDGSIRGRLADVKDVISR